MPFQFFTSSTQDSPHLTVPGIGLELTVRLSPEVSGEALSVIETVNAPGLGPPLHRHRETEVFRVLEGRYLFEVDGRRFEASAGDLVSVPGGAAHGFVNITERPARQLVMILPGMDAYKFFSELAHLFAAGPPSRDKLNAFGGPWGMEFLGPPLSVK